MHLLLALLVDKHLLKCHEKPASAVLISDTGDNDCLRIFIQKFVHVWYGLHIWVQSDVFSTLFWLSLRELANYVWR